MSQFNEILKNLRLINEAKEKNQALNVITLFSGMGAPEIALDKLGIKYRVVIASEIDNDAATVYKKLHGKKLLHKDNSFIPNVYDVISQKKNLSEDIDLLVAGFPCFAAGTLVMTDKGLLPIEEVQVGDLVLTHNNRYRKVLTTMQKENAELYKVKGQGFPEIIVTSEHPFYTLKTKNSDPEWINTINLQKRYKIGSPTNTINKNQLESYSKDLPFWEFVGRFICDGWCKVSPRPDRENDLAYSVNLCCSFDKKDEIINLLDSTKLKYSYYKERLTYRFELYNKELYEFLLKCGTGANNKCVHPDLWCLPINTKKAFLKGYFKTDSSFKNNSQSVTSISLKLLYEIRLLVAETYNLSSSIIQSHKKGKCIIEGQEYNQNNTYYLRFKKEPQKQISFLKNNVIWGNIKSVEKLDKKETVYNLEVEEDNSYTVNTIIVHNCQAFSTEGKQYGIYSRKVKPVNSIKPFVLNIKKHLSNISGDFAITVNNDKSDPLPEGLPEGTKVKILPESDGKLSFETLKIAQTFKPKVIILENVSAFGSAVIDDEAVPSEFNNLSEAKIITPQKSKLGVSGPANLYPSKDNKNNGGYLRALGNIFNKIGYSFYPMYLDPTSYTDSVVRRPRIYIIGVRNDIETRINPDKLEYFNNKITTNFGLDLDTNGFKSKNIEFLDKSLEYIMNSKYSKGYMSKNPKELVKNLIAKFGYNKLNNITDYIIKKLTESGKLNLRSFQLNNFNTDIIDKEISSLVIKNFINSIRVTSIPILIDTSNKIDTIDYLVNVIEKGVLDYFGESYGYYKLDDLQGNLKIKDNKNKLISSKPEKKDNKNKPISSKPEKKDDSFIQLNLDLEDIVESIIESIENNTDENLEQIDKMAINKLKEIIIKKILVKFLIIISKKKSLSYIPTIIKSSNIPNIVGGSGNANYFILRNKTGEFTWGYLHPAILAKLMGMYTKNTPDSDNVYQALASTKLANGKMITPNKIIERIGNSMSIDVLEKLFKSLISMKVFE